MSTESARGEAEFIPAFTLAEAFERIYAITGRSPEHSPGGSRAGKRALMALRDSLGLEIDVVRTPADMASAVSVALGVDWRPEAFTDLNTVNLDGYNALLLGASHAFRQGSLAQLEDQRPQTLAGPEWTSFRAARSKIEAVTRIAALTDAPTEWLGPGSKEHKSVLLNLAHNLFPRDPRIDMSSKTRLGASLAAVLGVPWTDQCSSTGETIQLMGLNTLLAGAERHLGLLGTDIASILSTPEAEGDALAAALLDGLPATWDGRTAVTWLADNELRGAYDNEWQGFYGEELARIALARSFAPRPSPLVVRYGNTVFDYSLNRVWDIKVHTELRIFGEGTYPGNNALLLNDERAMRACVDDQGLGFLVISGAALMDDSGQFVEWHRRFKASRQRDVPAFSNSGVSRIRKAAFEPRRIEAFWVANVDALRAAITSGSLGVRPIGRQAPRKAGGAGAARANKFELRMRQARATLRVATHSRSARGDEGT